MDVLVRIPAIDAAADTACAMTPLQRVRTDSVSGGDLLEEDRAAQTPVAPPAHRLPPPPDRCPPSNSVRRVASGPPAARQPLNRLPATRSAQLAPMQFAAPNPAHADGEERDTVRTRSHELSTLRTNSVLDRSLAERPDPLKFHTIPKLAADVRETTEVALRPQDVRTTRTTSDPT
ncbi:hypothetical protein HLB44_34870 [Aquincola sp. S2]|uniref:Uncharacterized protein n=1 Tax=Pseudaquabacterium terrae TaxID=2732868 RepID=A0ABX2ETV2_9BURK|nr:hypothetical protein [Aquabacterium terrae]NRF72180.1 hypothetical protein [Aquabacterium terrae]